MYAARHLMPNFLPLAEAAPGIMEAIRGGGIQENPVLKERLVSFDLEKVSGLSAMLSQGQITRLQELVHGRLSESNLAEARIALGRLELAGLAINYHAQGRPGKVSVATTKPLRGFGDLKKAYSPGVAYASRLVHYDRRYQALVTNVMNSVDIVSDGSAVLGEGPLGPWAFHPVGEGKAGLMLVSTNLDANSRPLDLGEERFRKIYIDNNATPEEVEKYIDDFVETVIRSAPGTGGYNIEDVGNKTCFRILALLQKRMKRLVWHDDQQGTAGVVVASLLASLRIQGKLSPEAVRSLRIVIAGAGAAGIVCGRLIRRALRRICEDFRDDQIIMRDSRGLITTSRTDLSPEKRQFAVSTDLKDLDEVLKGADIFIGVTPVGSLKLTQEQVRSMAHRPVIFALANPDPEILPEEVEEVRDDAIVLTGRADRKNQANNSNKFPGTLAGGLDVGATVSTDDMALAAAFAAAEIPFEPVLSEIQSLYPYELIPGSRDYVVASAFDPRVHFRVAQAVAREAVRSAIATFPFDEEGYAEWFYENRLQNAFVVPSSPSILLKKGASLFASAG